MAYYLLTIALIASAGLDVAFCRHHPKAVGAIASNGIGCAEHGK